MKLSNYGFIMKDPAYTETQKAELKTEGFMTTVCCVADNDAAVKAAKAMADAGAQLIELCGAFKEDDIKIVVEAVAGKTAIGNAVMSDDQRQLFLAKLKG